MKRISGTLALTARAPRISLTGQAKRGTKPSKLTPQREEAILTLLRAGNTRDAAAAGAQIDYSTFWRWCQRWPRFRRAVEEAENQAEVMFASRIAKAAREAEVTDHYDTRGNLIRRVVKYDWKAAAWWLERRRPERWKRTERVEVSGPNGGPIEAQKTTVVVWHPSPEELEQLRSAMSELPPDVREPILIGPGSDDPTEPVLPTPPDPASGDLPQSS